jgi:hypothetical protein
LLWLTTAFSGKMKGITWKLLAYQEPGISRVGAVPAEEGFLK